MRLIDADALIRIIDNTELTFDGGVDINELEHIIRNAPTIEIESCANCKYGDHDGYECVRCGHNYQSFWEAKE